MLVTIRKGQVPSFLRESCKNFVMCGIDNGTHWNIETVQASDRHDTLCNICKTDIQLSIHHNRLLSTLSQSLTSPSRYFKMTHRLRYRARAENEIMKEKNLLRRRLNHWMHDRWDRREVTTNKLTRRITRFLVPTHWSFREINPRIWHFLQYEHNMLCDSTDLGGGSTSWSLTDTANVRVNEHFDLSLDDNATYSKSPI